MTPLLLAALLWIGLHVGVAGTALRGRLAARLGERGFLGVFSLASAVAITLLVLAWRGAGTAVLWTAPDWLRWLLVAAMLPALVLFAGSLLSPNPTAVGAGRALALEPRGVLRITRHPMLCGFAIWSAVHVLGNGDAAAAVFFGAFAVTALLGIPSLDAKVAARDPAAWAGFARITSRLPFAAIAGGRNRIVASELALPVAAGAALWAALLHWHPALFGVSPLPS